MNRSKYLLWTVKMVWWLLPYHVKAALQCQATWHSTETCYVLVSGKARFIYFFSVIYPPLELHSLTPYTASQCLSDKYNFMPEPLCSQPFCVTEANPPSSAALLWSSIIPWPPLTLQGAHCVLITEWSSRHWPPMAFECPPVQPYSMPSCLSLGGHFASNGGEAAEASSVIVIYNIAYFILLYSQAIHSKAIHIWVSTCGPWIGLASCCILLSFLYFLVLIYSFSKAN